MKALIIQRSGLERPGVIGEALLANEEAEAFEDAAEPGAVNAMRRKTLQTWERDVIGRTSAGHFPAVSKSKISGNGAYSNPRSNCMLCKRFVPSVCQKCHVYLCLKSGDGRDCFTEFHTQNKFRINHQG